VLQAEAYGICREAAIQGKGPGQQARQGNPDALYDRLQVVLQDSDERYGAAGMGSNNKCQLREATAPAAIEAALGGELLSLGSQGSTDGQATTRLAATVVELGLLLRAVPKMRNSRQPLPKQQQQQQPCNVTMPASC
jgi:hypothetical protein